MIRRAVLAGGAALLAAGAAAPAPPHGRPDLVTAVNVLVAGGGPAAFKTLTLLSALTAGEAGEALTALVRTFGVAAVKTSVEILDFVVADAQRRLAERHITLPPLPDPDALDRKGLRTALVAAARTQAGSADIGTLLERLVSQPVRVAVERDITLRFGAPAAVVFTGAANAQLTRLAHPDDA